MHEPIGSRLLLAERFVNTRSLSYRTSLGLKRSRFEKQSEWEESYDDRETIGLIVGTGPDSSASLPLAHFLFSWGRLWALTYTSMTWLPPRHIRPRLAADGGMCF